MKVSGQLKNKIEIFIFLFPNIFYNEISLWGIIYSVSIKAFKKNYTKILYHHINRFNSFQTILSYFHLKKTFDL